MLTSLQPLVFGWQTKFRASRRRRRSGPTMHRSCPGTCPARYFRQCLHLYVLCWIRYTRFVPSPITSVAKEVAAHRRPPRPTPRMKDPFPGESRLRGLHCPAGSSYTTWCPYGLTTCGGPTEAKSESDCVSVCLSSGAIAGIAIGVVVVIIGVGLLVKRFWCFHKSGTDAQSAPPIAVELSQIAFDEPKLSIEPYVLVLLNYTITGNLKYCWFNIAIIIFFCRKSLKRVAVLDVRGLVEDRYKYFFFIGYLHLCGYHELKKINQSP